MNKIASILSVAAICLGFAACDEVEESLSKPQTNPQETIFDAAKLSVQPVGDVVNVATPEAPQVKVATATAEDFPQASTLQLIMQIGKTEAFDNAAETNIVAHVGTTGAVLVEAAALNADYKRFVTRNPGQGEACVRFIANAVNGTEVVRLGGPDTYYGVGKIKVQPAGEEIAVEQAYYLVYGTEKIKFLHSAVDPYDDPVFTVNFEGDPATEWSIVSEAGKEYGPVPSEKDENAGALAQGAGKGAGIAAGPHKLEINMRDLTYKVSLAIQQLYTPGNTNGWSQPASQVLTTTDYVHYRGFAHLNGDFKFTSQPNWNGINYGSTGVDGELTTDGGAGNLSAPADALYWVVVNLVDLTYEMTPVSSLGCIGGFNGWGSQEALKPSADFLTWSGEVKMTAGDEWKFRANDDWGINLGGALDNIVYNGDNLKAEATGTMTVTLNLSAVPYTATVVAK